jgi:hypothetical protein
MKRRIVCDRTEPQCHKCLKKGLICPGMGIRYRFNAGIAARGKLRGKSYIVPSNSNVEVTRDHSENQSVVQPLTWITNEVCAVNPLPTPALMLETSDGNQEDSDQPINNVFKDQDREDADDLGLITCEGNAELLVMPGLAPCLEIVDARTRYFFTHCRSPKQRQRR